MSKWPSPVLFYLYPAFTAILSPWITGESTPGTAWILICAAFAGTCVILWPGETSDSLNLGHLFALMASVLSATTILLVRRLGRENNVYTLYFYLCLTGALAGVGPLLMRGPPLLPVHPTAWIELIAVAVLSMAAQLSINQALARLPATTVCIMMTAEVPLVACFGVFYLGEPLGWRLVVGALLIFGCAIGLNLPPTGLSRDRPLNRKPDAPS